MPKAQIEDPKCCTPESASQKLKILCLHGYAQNAEVFRAKTGSFRKLVHKWAQFNYVNAPHKLTLEDIKALEEPDSEQSQNEERYGWFFNRGTQHGGPAIGFEESVEFMEQVFAKDGPFDGVLAFSQGACFLGLLCDLQQRGLTKHIRFSFAIMASGFKSKAWPHLKYYMDRITLPSLHVFGEADKVIPAELSEGLSLCFEEPVVVKHPGGHYLPAAAAQKHEYQKFFKLQVLQKQYREQIEEKSH